MQKWYIYGVNVLICLESKTNKPGKVHHLIDRKVHLLMVIGKQ